MEAIVGVRADDPQCGPDADASQAGLLKIFASLLARDDALADGVISSSKKRVVGHSTERKEHCLCS